MGVDKCEEEKHEIKARPSRMWEEKAQNQEHCGAMVDTQGPFAACIKALGNEKIMGFFDNCKFDVYESQGDKVEAKKMACNALEGLVTRRSWASLTTVNLMFKKPMI